MAFKIREIEVNEYPFLKEMLFKALYVREGEKPFDRAILDSSDLQKYIANFGQWSDLGLVLLDGEKLVGAIWSRLFTIEKPSYGFVDVNTPELTIAIQTDYHNKGLGTRLMNAFFELALEKGFEQISLSADKESPVVRLYLRLGFQIIKQEGTAYTMLKKL